MMSIHCAHYIRVILNEKASLRFLLDNRIVGLNIGNTKFRLNKKALNTI